MPKIILFAISCFFASTAIAQTAASKIDEAYLIPFATSENRVELDVVNTGEQIAENVQVRVREKPLWLELDEETVSLAPLEAGEEQLAAFSFAVDREAPIDLPEDLAFEIFSEGQVIGEKVFRLQVEAPKEAALMQNYPNPFNPETTIGFDLPSKGAIDLRIYDILGREVALLANDERVPGHHKVRWDASRFASGTYFYVLKTKTAEGEFVLLSEKMLLVK